MTIVDPKRVNIPHGPKFFLARVFCAAASSVPAAPRIIVDLRDSRIASLGTYVGSSSEVIVTATVESPLNYRSIFTRSGAIRKMARRPRTTGES